MKCSLCGKAIEGYEPGRHHLDLEEGRSAEPCQACVEAVMKWQARRLAKVFPTQALKERFADQKSKSPPHGGLFASSEGVRFELTVELPPRQISSLVPSTARPSFHPSGL